MGTYNKARFTTMRTTRSLKKRLEDLRPKVEENESKTNLSFGQIIGYLIDSYQKQERRKVQVFTIPSKTAKHQDQSFKGGENVRHKQGHFKRVIGGTVRKTTPKGITATVAKRFENVNQHGVTAKRLVYEITNS